MSTCSPVVPSDRPHVIEQPPKREHQTIQELEPARDRLLGGVIRGRAQRGGHERRARDDEAERE